MNSVYDYIRANYGVLSVDLNVHTLNLPKQYTVLNQAIDKSIEECIATYVINTLLESSIDTINMFIYALQQSEQEYLVKHFYTVDPNSSKKLYNYISVIECDKPILQSCKRKIQQNYSAFHSKCNIHKLNNLLLDERVISVNSFRKINRWLLTDNRDKAMDHLIDVILNGNSAQHYRLYKVVFDHQPLLLDYI